MIYIGRLAKLATQILFGLAALLASAQMAVLGSIVAPLDVSELDQSNVSKLDQNLVSTLLPWETVYGYRLTAMKYHAKYYFDVHNNDFQLQEAERLILGVLQISPFEPTYWLLLARIRQLNFYTDDDVISALRLSYVTGRSVYQLMGERFDLAISLWSKLDESDKAIVVNDLAIGPQRSHENLAYITRLNSNEDLQELAKLMSLKNLAISEQIVEISKSRRP